MIVIVCLDNADGIMFNHRRQSRDANLIKDVELMVDGNTLLLNSYSAPLFDGTNVKLKISESFLSEAGDSDFCFVENVPAKDYENQISKLIIYKWNRDYPSDYYFDIDYVSNFKLKSSEDFTGTSHDSITKEVYVK